MTLQSELDAFCAAHEIARTRGALALMVQLSRAFSQDTLPIDPDDYLTDREGQVAGLGGGNLRKILADHGITRQLAKEGGRTNRGNMGLMRAYAEFVNNLGAAVDFTALEEYWVDRVRVFFTHKPFKLTKDPSRSITDAVNGLLEQAARRQRENPGMKYAGSIMQHLVAAKLELLMPGIEIHGVADADDQTGREGDFIIGDSAIHCTTAPANLLVEKCKANLEHGLNPVIVTVSERVITARTLLEDAGIGSRVEVWDLQQFLSTNVFEHGMFNSASRKDVLSELVANYNDIVDEYETDPSLRIEYDS